MILLKNLKLITFDVTNTLLKFKIPPGKQYNEIGIKYGIQCDPDKLGENFKQAWNKMTKEHPNFGCYTGIGWVKWWKQVIAGTFCDSKVEIDDKKLDEISMHLIEMYKNAHCWQKSEGVLDILSYLTHKQMPIGIISNFDPRLNETLRNVRLRHYFQFVINSYEAGAEKPNVAIFKKAMQLSGNPHLKAQECLHIGDSLIFDYNGAKNAGWHAFIVNDKERKLANLDSDNVSLTLSDLYKKFLKANG